MDQEPSVVQSTMNKPLLILGAYMYRIHRRKVDTIWWACRKDRQTGCKARLSTDLEYRVISKGRVEHSCVPDQAEIEVKITYETCRKRVREETSVPVNIIYKEEYSKIYSKGLNFVTKVPKYDSVKGTLCKERRKVLGTEQNPKNCVSVEFPSSLLELPNGEHFLIADRVINPGKRICIFGGMHANQLMSRGSICLFDGTFRSCPKQFTQIYTIHVDVGSNEYETNICPAIFALLPDKQESTYKIMLEIIKKWCPSWSPELVKVDFEASMMTAIKSTFPQTQISGCSFHFGQCLWRKIQTLGLVKDYREDEAVKQTCKMCAALAYLPPHCIQEAWMMILQSAPENEKLDCFLAYFVDQWLENSNIPPEVWNVYNQRHRTNNAVEGWNRKLNALVGMKSPNIFFLVDKLKQLAMEASFSSSTEDWVDPPPNGRRRTSSWTRGFN